MDPRVRFPLRLSRRPRQTPIRRRTAALLGATALVLGSVGWADAAKPPASAPFVNFSLAGTPPQAPGTTCPGSGSSCANGAAEPAIRAARDGSFYASSENGLGGGTLAWKSTDGGLHYSTLLSPNDVSGVGNTGFEPGGGDTDVAVAPVANASGRYNVYVSSLTLANVDVSTSTDGGATWTLHPITTPETLDDREWVAADGASKICLSYHNAPQGITVGCSTDAGATWLQYSPALDALHSFQTSENAIGNLAIDPASHTIYQIYSAITTAAETACAPQLGVVAGTCDYHGVYMAVSTDGGLTFTDRTVYINPNVMVGYGHQFTNVSTDAAGNVYAVYGDNHIIWYSWSTNHGLTWSKPKQVSKSPASTAIFPWSVGGAAGKLDVVYYGSSYYDGVTVPDNYPASATWSVYFAQNLSATSPSGSFSQVAASPVVHTGGVCESGVACTGNRDLYDDFGVAANPRTGLASIVYSDDQYRNDASNAPSSTCTAAGNNTASCDHTAIATQVSGKGIGITAP
ncbi:MAG TPA: hypothetical protein VHS36_07700 [Candidatus Limnocylindrales bacterium]|nr:hypothetical protein [Candidatus Limnocylindrales bacterium]